jgi:hypothetical protein
VDRAGNPALKQPLVPWQHGPLPDGFHAVFLASSAKWILLAFIMLVALAAFLRMGGDARRRTGALPGLTLTALLASVCVESMLLQMPWPLHRLWIMAVPLLLLAAALAIDDGLPNSRRVAKLVSMLGVVVMSALIVNGAGRIRLKAYREWPDNFIVPDVIEAIREARETTPYLLRNRIRLGHPWYQDACFRYYRARRGAEWLRLAAWTSRSPADRDFILMNMRSQRSKVYTPFRQYPTVELLLVRRTP